MRDLRLVAMCLGAALVLTSCAPVTEPPTKSPVALESPDSPGVLATGLEAPWSIVFHGSSALISERDSALVIELTAEGRTRVIGTIAGVEPAGEGGLLGLAIKDGVLYSYSTTAHGNWIERRPITGDDGVLRLGEPETVLDGLPKAGFHNGGRLAFGPDGMLYATVGDTGNRASAQDRRALTGKILRMTPDGEVPPDNPFPNSLVYSFGHRNPQGIGWAADGTMFASEFGQDTWDELNRIEPGGNYGWPVVEGIAHDDRFIDPLQQWAPSDASPSGLTITDDAIWIANLRGERLREVPLDELSTAREHWTGEFGRLRDVAGAPDGSLWALTNNTDGRGDPGPGDDRILRLVP